VIDAEHVSRSATFVFFAGDRFHGVVTAHVAGPESAHYGFTSSLPVQVLKDLAPVLEPVFGSSPEGVLREVKNAKNVPVPAPAPAG
jgi:hypothetical protein